MIARRSRTRHPANWTRQESQTSPFPSGSVRGRPEVAMQVAPPAEFQVRPELGAQFEQIFLRLHRLHAVLPAPGNEFLPHVRRIADDGIEWRQINRTGCALAS